MVLISGRGFPRGGEKSGLVLELWDKQICGHLEAISTGKNTRCTHTGMHRYGPWSSARLSRRRASASAKGCRRSGWFCLCSLSRTAPAQQKHQTASAPTPQPVPFGIQVAVAPRHQQLWIAQPAACGMASTARSNWMVSIMVVFNGLQLPRFNSMGAVPTH